MYSTAFHGRSLDTKKNNNLRRAGLYESELCSLLLPEASAAFKRSIPQFYEPPKVYLSLGRDYRSHRRLDGRKNRHQLPVGRSVPERVQRRLPPLAASVVLNSAVHMSEAP